MCPETHFQFLVNFLLGLLSPCHVYALYVDGIMYTSVICYESISCSIVENLFLFRIKRKNTIHRQTKRPNVCSAHCSQDVTSVYSRWRLISCFSLQLCLTLYNLVVAFFLPVCSFVRQQTLLFHVRICVAHILFVLCFSLSLFLSFWLYLIFTLTFCRVSQTAALYYGCKLKCRQIY